MSRINLFDPPPAPLPGGDDRLRTFGLVAAVALWAAVVLPGAAGAVQTALELRDLHAEEVEAEHAQAALRAVSAETEQAGGTGSRDALGGLPALLGVLRVSAEESGVRIDRVEPEDAEQSGGVRVVPVRVRVSGDGHAVGRFVDAVERSSLVVPVRRLLVTGSPDGRVAAVLDITVAESRG